MHVMKRAASAVVSLAVTASLAVVPALLQPAAAAPGAGARASVTAECDAALDALVAAKIAKARAKRALVKARKALRAAKRSHSAPRIRKAKRHLKHARHRYVVRSHAVSVQSARVGYACSAPNSSARATGTGLDLSLLAVVTHTVTTLDLTQLKALLDTLLPGVSTQLSDAQLQALLAGFNAGTPSLDDLTILLGSVFTPDELQSLLDGTASPALVQALTDHIIGELSGLSGVQVPGGLDASALQTIVNSVTALLGGLGGGVGGVGGTGGGSTGGTGGGLLCGLLHVGC